MGSVGAGRETVGLEAGYGEPGVPGGLEGPVAVLPWCVAVGGGHRWGGVACRGGR